jgi:diguanylate cyclase (GGDEF)-like protein
LDLSPRGWGRVIAMTVLGTLFCIVVAISLDQFNFASLDAVQVQRAMWMNIVVPLLLAGPLLFFFSVKLRQLAISRHELAVLAATDHLTGLFNRRAFLEVADAYLTSLAEHGDIGGTLLLVDADNFKAINDAFGHEIGDQALVLLSNAIRQTLRQTDLVGRIGGEEFAIMLPGATHDQGRVAAERLCQAVTEIYFAPQGRRHPLSISVGGASFQGRHGLSPLFIAADAELYTAKREGRNRVVVSPLPAGQSIAA